MLDVDHIAVPHRASLDASGRRRRIAFVTESYALGGVERWLDMLISGLDRSRFDPVLICSDVSAIDPFVADVEECGVDVIRTDYLTPFSSSSSPSAILRLARLLRAQGAEAVHAQVLGGAGARSIALAAALAGVRAVVVTIHGSLLQPLSALKSALSRVFDRVFVTAYTTSSQSSRASQIAMAGRSPKRIRVIPHAIECEGFDPDINSMLARHALGLPKDGPVIGLVGRMEEQKGVEDFLRMARLVSDSEAGAHFLVVGDGQELPKYRMLAEDLGIADRVHFTGRRTDIARCLAAMDVFVLASLFEPFGLVLAEAMAMKTPVVATDVGGVSEVISDGVTGMLVPAADPAAMAKSALEYVRRPELARRHGEDGRKRVLEKFTASRMVADMERLYERCLMAEQAHPKMARVWRSALSD
ncbi:glycosyl transferase family 1 [Capsulimonas corticalis]|uniref:Glycosyl transferase family 1 n=1 Tax=Capsulimonas corticalis TaxID=2219043 RepID=A0A402D0D2_9BACT|nr:glycosyltransferase [Capsulimonas corticalis]BDI33656.1 glycosyl transferase family 1 [Capsulimonas corticalis]